MPWRAGTNHIVTSPLEFEQLLAGLVPRPHLCLATTAFRPSILPAGGPLRVGMRHSLPQSRRPPAEIETTPLGDCPLATHSTDH
jgi:hypothetical protein